MRGVLLWFSVSFTLLTVIRIFNPAVKKDLCCKNENQHQETSVLSQRSLQSRSLSRRRIVIKCNHWDEDLCWGQCQNHCWWNDWERWWNCTDSFTFWLMHDIEGQRALLNIIWNHIKRCAVTFMTALTMNVIKSLFDLLTDGDAVDGFCEHAYSVIKLLYWRADDLLLWSINCVVEEHVNQFWQLKNTGLGTAFDEVTHAASATVNPQSCCLMNHIFKQCQHYQK